jgi:Glycosyl hydrolases family 18
VLNKLNLVAAVITVATLSFCSTSAFAAWPGKVFAPYMYIGSGDNFKITDCDDACGLKHYTLAFIIARQEGRGESQKFFAEPAWDGRTPMEKDVYHDQIDEIRKRGGDVIISFGGAAGKDLALVETDVDKLEKEYQSILDRYKFTWLDFDIEGKQLEDDAANERRNTVLARLQQENPGLLISFTLPVDPNGISKHSRDMLKDAVSKGVKVKSANVMTMYFGPKFFKDKTMTELCIASVEKAYEQCQKIDPAIQIGITPMIGKGGDKGSELFSLDDAKAVGDWAKEKPYVCSIGFWSVNRDSGKPSKRGGDGGNTASGIPQQPFDYSKVLDKFTSK